MKRRRVLSVLGSGALVISAGCLSNINIEARALGEETLEFGVAARYNGVEVMPTAYTHTDVLGITTSVGRRTIHSPPSGSIFLLTRLWVENVADAPRIFPSGTSSTGPSGDIELRYGESSGGGIGGTARRADRLGVGNAWLEGYEESLHDRGIAGKPAKPGTSVSGWVVHIVPREFDPSRATLVVAWGGKPDADLTGLKRFEWAFSTGEYSSPEQLAG